MNIHPDFEELLKLLEEHKVEYMNATSRTRDKGDAEELIKQEDARDD